MKKIDPVLTIENVNTPEKAGLAIKRLRKFKNLSQADLAKMMNMRQPTISDVESGKGTLESFFKIVQALQIKISFFNQEAQKKTKVRTKVSKMLDYLENED